MNNPIISLNTLKEAFLEKGIRCTWTTDDQDPKITEGICTDIITNSGSPFQYTLWVNNTSSFDIHVTQETQVTHDSITTSCLKIEAPVDFKSILQLKKIAKGLKDGTKTWIMNKTGCTPIAVETEEVDVWTQSKDWSVVTPDEVTLLCMNGQTRKYENIWAILNADND